MEQQLTALETALRDEVAAYTVLVNRLPFKIALIRKNRVSQLENLTRQEEAEIKRLAELERCRIQAMRELRRLISNDVNSTLSGLLGHVPLGWRDRLAGLGESLRKLARELHDGHETCQVLLRASLEYVDFTMQLVASTLAQSQSDVYGGTFSDGERRSPSILLDRRA